MSEQNRGPREIEFGDSELLVLIGDAAGNYMYANESFLKRKLKGKIKGHGDKNDGNPLQLMQDFVLTIRWPRNLDGHYKILDNGDFMVAHNLSPSFRTASMRAT